MFLQKPLAPLPGARIVGLAQGRRAEQAPQFVQELRSLRPLALGDDHSHRVAIKAGVLDGKVIDPKAVKALADLPSKEQLLGMVASALLAPITGLACALNGNIQNLAYALEAVRKQKESA